MLASALLLGATVADAQVQLQGRVIEDETGRPIAGAAVTLENARGKRLGTQVTNELGYFGFSVTDRGPVRLQAERIGFARSSSAMLHFDGYSVFALEIRLDVAAVLMAPLEVVTRARAYHSPTLAGFNERRESGAGWYVTRDEIDRKNASSVSDILRGAPGVTLFRSVVYMNRGPSCPAQVFVDGFHMNRSIPGANSRRNATPESFRIDQVVLPGTVEGIEVYQGLSRMPAEFLTPDAACGVVAIWTRRGG